MPSDFTSPPTQSTVVSRQTNWYLDRTGQKNVWKLKNPTNIQTSEYCTPVCGGLSKQPPPHKLRGQNITCFVRVVQSDENSHNKKLYSVVTVIVGGAQLHPDLWAHITEHVLCRCQTATHNILECKCTQIEGVREIPLFFHEPSNAFFGRCQFNVVNEAAFTGDNIHVAHGVEVTMQRFRPLLISDYVFSHTILGLSNEYRHCEYTCTHCHINKKQLHQPWYQLKEKPTLRTSTSMQQCLAALKAGKLASESKGVVADPLMQWDPKNIILAFLHCFGGVFNKIFETSKARLVKIIDEPFMGRSQEAAKMNDRITQLDAQQRQEALKIELLQAEEADLQASLIPLTQYLTKLNAPRGNTATKGLRAEIKHTEKRIAEVKKQILKIKVDIKQLQQSVKKSLLRSNNLQDQCPMRYVQL